MRLSRYKGFSIIELMIVVAIIAIIAGVAYPSYRASVLKTNRADAQADLMMLAQWMERKYLQQDYSYLDDGATPTLPQDRTPVSGTKVYDLALDSVSKNAFVLIATPVGGQTDDKCGTLELDNAGTKTAEKGGTSVTNCW